MNLPDARKVAEGWRKALIKFAGAPVGNIGKIGQALVRLDLEIDARDNATDELIGEVRKVCNADNGLRSVPLRDLKEKLKNWDSEFDRKAEDYDAAAKPDNAKNGLIDCFVHGKGRDAACRDCFLMDRC